MLHAAPRGPRSLMPANGGSSRSSASACIVGANLGRVDRVRQQSIERPFVDLEDLTFIERADRRRTGRSLEQTHLPERVAALEDAEHLHVHGVRILLLDGEPARGARRRTRVGRSPCRKTACPARTGRSVTRPARSFRTSTGRSSNAGNASISSAASTRHLDSGAEDRRPQRSPGHAGRRLETAGSRPRRAGPAKKTTATPGAASSRTTVPERRDQATEDAFPEEVGRVEAEDRERDADHRVEPETDLLLGQPLTRPKLVPEVVLDELQRPRAKVGHLDQVAEDPVAVQFQQRDQVQEDHEVVDERELVQQPRDARIREDDEREARDAGRSPARRTDRRTTA